jgi:hypothetical protein
MPADDVCRRRSTEQAVTANPSWDAERSSSKSEMCSLLGPISSSFNGYMFDPSIMVAGVLFRMGLLLLHLA